MSDILFTPNGTSVAGGLPLHFVDRGDGLGGVGVNQEPKDTNRSLVSFYMAIPVILTATETLLSLTATRAGALVAATTTPAVVSSLKTFRLTRLSANYIATATTGYGIVRLRFNNSGAGSLTSPVATQLAVGGLTPTTVNSTNVTEAALQDGIEFSAGTGIVLSAQGYAAATAAAAGYIFVTATGFEY